MIWGCVRVPWSEGRAVKAADKEQPEKPGDICSGTMYNVQCQFF